MSRLVIQAPVDLAAPTRVGPRTYRKQLLRKVDIDYPNGDGTTRRVSFDDEYLADLAASFNDGAYDLAPFILADAKNAHTLAPERYRGELKAVEVTPDGLDGIIELSEDAAELVERTGRRLGVSPRIKDAVSHVDGRKFKRAIHHVLGTLDPRMQGKTHGLRPWEPIDLSDTDPTEHVVDLSTHRYQEDRMSKLSLDHLTADDLDTLASLAAASGIDLSAEDDDEPGEQVPDDADGTEDGTQGGEGEGSTADELGDEHSDDIDAQLGITDEELDRLIDGELESMGIDVSLSADDDGTLGDTLDLSDDGLEDHDTVDQVLERRQRQVDLSADNGGDEAATLRAQLAIRDYMSQGVPRYVLDLAADVLAMGPEDTLDLASPVDGQSVDVRAVVTGILDAMKGTVDLSREDGHGIDQEADGQMSPTAQAWVDHLEHEGMV